MFNFAHALKIVNFSACVKLIAARLLLTESRQFASDCIGRCLSLQAHGASQRNTHCSDAAAIDCTLQQQKFCLTLQALTQIRSIDGRSRRGAWSKTWVGRLQLLAGESGNHHEDPCSTGRKVTLLFWYMVNFVTDKYISQNHVTYTNCNRVVSR